MTGKERFYLPIIYGNYLKKYDGSAKTYHEISDVLKAASERRGKVRAKEKLFLEDKSSRALGVPSGLLKSKVLLVTGRGNKNKFDRLSKVIKDHGESIESIFGSNFIIDKSLEKYKNIFSASDNVVRVNYDKRDQKNTRMNS